jgi:type I restriction enzyme S subunit
MSAEEWVSGTWGDLVAFRKQVRTAEGQLLTVATKGAGTRPAEARPESRTPTHLIKSDELIYLRQGAAAGVIAVSDHEGLVSVNFPVGTLSGRVSPDFIRLLLRSPEVQAVFRGVSAGTAQPFLSERDFVNVPVRYPSSSDVQRRIVDLLTSADAVIDSLAGEVMAARNLRYQLLHGLLANSQTPESASASSETEWVSGTWGDLVSFRKQVKTAEGNLLTVGTKGAGTRFAESRPESRTPTHLIRRGELVYLRQGAAAGAIAVSDHDGLVSVNFPVGTLNSRVCPGYVRLLLQSSEVQAAFRHASVGTAQPFLSEKDFANVPVRYPRSVGDQQHIADLLSAVDQAVSSRTERLEAARTVRDQLLHDLLSGTHTIPESYDRFVAEAAS